MTRLRWWIHRNIGALSYLFIVAVIAGLLAIAILKGGW